MTRNRKYTLLLPLSLIVGFIWAGAFHIWWYRDMPIVRDSLVYAKIVQAMIDYGSDFSVVHHGHNKALGFPYLSLPLVKVWGTGLGLKISSFIWTSLWVLTVWVWWRRMREFLNHEDGSSPTSSMSQGRIDVVFLIFALVNPLVFYQFISAYPDSLYAMTFLWSVYFLDRTLSGNIRWWDGVLFGFVSLFSIWVKHSGFILLLILPVFVVCRSSILPSLWREKRKELVIAILSLSAFLVTTAFAQAGRIDVFNLGHNVDNFMRGGNKWSIFKVNILNLRLYFLYSFSTLIPLLLYWRHFKKHKEWYITLIVFILSILIYRGGRLNIRYYLAVAPLLVFIIMLNWQRLRSSWKRVFFVSFAVINGFTLLFYNSVAFHAAVRDFVPLSSHDNLRLTREQRDRKESIDTINRLFNEGYNTLIFLSDYKGDIRWYVWEQDGYYERGLSIIYSRHWNRDILDREKLSRVIVYDETGTFEKNERMVGRMQKVSNKVYVVEM